MVTFARMSTPASKVAFGLPSLSMPRSPVRTPDTRVPSHNTSTPAKPVKKSMPASSTRVAIHRAKRFSEMMWLPWFLSGGGMSGSAILPPASRK